LKPKTQAFFLSTKKSQQLCFLFFYFSHRKHSNSILRKEFFLAQCFFSVFFSHCNFLFLFSRPTKRNVEGFIYLSAFKDFWLQFLVRTVLQFSKSRKTIFILLTSINHEPNKSEKVKVNKNRYQKLKSKKL
jgi:hypothetical protein